MSGASQNLGAVSFFATFPSAGQIAHTHVVQADSAALHQVLQPPRSRYDDGGFVPTQLGYLTRLRSPTVNNPTI
jgi:hypothetical protein